MRVKSRSLDISHNYLGRRVVNQRAHVHDILIGLSPYLGVLKEVHTSASLYQVA
jgi:hypothetical protein